MSQSNEVKESERYSKRSQYFFKNLKGKFIINLIKGTILHIIIIAVKGGKLTDII